MLHKLKMRLAARANRSRLHLLLTSLGFASLDYPNSGQPWQRVYDGYGTYIVVSDLRTGIEVEITDDRTDRTWLVYDVDEAAAEFQRIAGDGR